REREREQVRERERLAVERRILLKEKQAAEALAQKAAELERSNADLRQFAYVASHDLQEPLRTLSSFCELLEKECDGKLGEDAQQYLRFITGAASRMTALIKGLLDYTRIGKAAKAVPVDCRPGVKQILSDLAASIAESRSRIDVGELPTVQGNDAELRLLFQNLISNAIKFRRKRAAPRIQISAAKEGAGWTFAVKDNGIGIEEQHD